MSANRIAVYPMKSRLKRNVIRRNYRWMREAGVSVVVARLVLDSTLHAAQTDDLLADIERERAEAVVIGLLAVQS